MQQRRFGVREHESAVSYIYHTFLLLDILNGKYINVVVHGGASELRRGIHLW